MIVNTPSVINGSQLQILLLRAVPTGSQEYPAPVENNQYDINLIHWKQSPTIPLKCMYSTFKRLMSRRCAPRIVML